MTVHCFCSTYGRPKMVAGALYLFLQQTYNDKFLTILDDSGCLVPKEESSFKIISVPDRFPSLASKFRYLRQITDLKDDDIILIWDDDDIYLPHYIESHVEILKKYFFSKPSEVYIFYKEELKRVRSGPLFYATIGFKVSCLEEVDWEEESDGKAFDQKFVLKMYRKFICGDPCLVKEPQFIYCTSHPYLRFSPLRMKHKEDAYKIYPELVNIKGKHDIVPELDDERKKILGMLSLDH